MLLTQHLSLFFIHSRLAGFRSWCDNSQVKVTFEQRCRDLEAFKNKFGHCKVPYKYSADPSLGQWCNNMRYYYNQIQQGQTPNSNLTQDQIARLEEIGFKCKVI